jgi:hypothetical protein
MLDGWRWPVVGPGALGDPARAGVAGAGFLDLRTGSRVRAVAVALAVSVVLETVRFVPVGVLTVLSLPRPRGDRVRTLPVAAAAGAGSLLIAVVVLVLEIGPPWEWPGPSDLLLPAVGCALGVGATLVWLAGRGARRRLLLVLGRDPAGRAHLGGPRSARYGRARAARPGQPGRDVRREASAV